MSCATLILYYHASMLTLQPPSYHMHFGGHKHDIREVRVYLEQLHNIIYPLPLVWCVQEE